MTIASKSRRIKTSRFGSVEGIIILELEQETGPNPLQHKSPCREIHATKVCSQFTYEYFRLLISCTDQLR